MLTAAEGLNIIHATYPDLDIRSHSYNNSGQNNDVLILNNEIVFRFPRTPHGARQLRIEAAILGHLQTRMTLQVPNPIYLNLGDAGPRAGGRGSSFRPGRPSLTGGPAPAEGASDQTQPTAWWQKPPGQSQNLNLGVQLTSWQRPLGLRAHLARRARDAARPAPAPEDRPGLRDADGKLPWERGIFSEGLPWSREREEQGRPRSRRRDDRPAPIGAFIGYRWIPGEPLWRDSLLAADDPRVVQNWADQLGTFLRELHGTPLDGQLTAFLPRYDTRARWTDFYGRVESKAFRYMRPDARVEVARGFEAYLSQPLNFEHPLTLVHGDFGPGNILLDHANQRVSGVIDFGSSGLDDPAVDLAALIGPFGYGEAFLRRFAKIYSIPPEDLERARFYAGTFGLQDAVYGIEHGDLQAFESGIAAYR